jgi:hypothetical protein
MLMDGNWPGQSFTCLSQEGASGIRHQALGSWYEGIQCILAAGDFYDRMLVEDPA